MRGVVEYVEVARGESERGEVVLRERHDPDAPAGSAAVLELRVNGVFVMDTLETTTESALARSALTRVERPAHVLVGGLGLGFTVREVLADTRVERLVVAEIEDVLVGWFRDGTIPHGPSTVADDRVHLAVADVRQIVAESPPERFDLVLLDVDNGPDYLVHDSNASLYQAPFLGTLHAAMASQGVLAVWASTPSTALARTLDQVFGNSGCEEFPVLLQGKEESYWLHTAEKVQSHGQPEPS